MPLSYPQMFNKFHCLPLWLEAPVQGANGRLMCVGSCRKLPLHSVFFFQMVLGKTHNKEYILHCNTAHMCSRNKVSQVNTYPP